LGMQKLPGNIKENIVLDINSIPDNIWDNEKFVIKNNMWEILYEFYSSRFIKKTWWVDKGWTRKRIEWEEDKTTLIYNDGIVDFSWRKELKGTVISSYDKEQLKLFQNVLQTIWANNAKNLFWFNKNWELIRWKRAPSKTQWPTWYYLKNDKLIQVVKPGDLSYSSYYLCNNNTLVDMGAMDESDYPMVYRIKDEYKNIV
jgi:hypothetical protein